MAVTIHAGQQFQTSSATGTTQSFVRCRGVPDRFLYVAAAIRSTATTITANGVVWWPSGALNSGPSQTFTQIGAVNSTTPSATPLRTEQWGLVNPAVSTGTNGGLVAITWAGVSGNAADILMHVFGGVDQTTPYTGFTSATNGAASLAGNTTSTLAISAGPVASDLVVDSIISDLLLLTTERVLPNATGMVAQTGTANGVSALGSYLLHGSSFTQGDTAVANGLSWKFKKFDDSVSNGHSFAQAAVVIKASSSGISAPSYVEQPSSQVALNFIGSGVASTPAAISDDVDPSDLGGAMTWGLPDQLLTTANSSIVRFTQYRPVTGVTLSGSGNLYTFAIGSETYGGGVLNPVPKGVKAQEWGGYGNYPGNPTTTVTTIAVKVPSTAVANDIFIVNFMTYRAAGQVAPTCAAMTTNGGTVGSNNPSGNWRQDIFWHRVQAGEPGTNFTFAVNGGNASNVYVTTAAYRNCLTTATPVAGFTAATATSATPTAPTITSTGNNSTAVFCYATGTANDFIGWNPATSGGAYSVRSLWDQVAITDLTVNGTASATGTQPITAPQSAVWSACSFFLLPAAAVGGTTYPRTASITTAHTVTAARVATLKRSASLSKGLTAALARVLRKPRAASTSQTTTATVAAVRKFVRTGTYSRASVMTTARKLTMNRAATAARSTVTAVIRQITSANHIARSAAATISHSMTTARKLTSKRGPTLSKGLTAAVVRILHLNRAPAVTTAHTAAAVRVVKLRRSGSFTSLPTGKFTVSRTVTPGAGTSFTGYGTYPELFIYVAAEFLNVTWRLEGTFFAGSGTAYMDLFDVTANQSVIGSQISTTSSTPTIIQSSTFTLLDSHTYRVRAGKSSGGQTWVSGARLGFTEAS